MHQKNFSFAEDLILDFSMIVPSPPHYMLACAHVLLSILLFNVIKIIIMMHKGSYRNSLKFLLQGQHLERSTRMHVRSVVVCMCMCAYVNPVPCGDIIFEEAR